MASESPDWYLILEIRHQNEDADGLAARLQFFLFAVIAVGDVPFCSEAGTQNLRVEPRRFRKCLDPKTLEVRSVRF